MVEETQQLDALENERGQLEGGTTLRERMRNIIKKYGSQPQLSCLQSEQQLE